MEIRRGTVADTGGVAAIYDAIHDEIEQGRYDMKWERGLYPTRQWAEERIAAGDLYVMADDGGRVVASAVMNHCPLPEYAAGRWFQPRDYAGILVLHTLVVHPRCARRGYGARMVRFFERMAAERGCSRVRLDTQAIDLPARALYRKLGYVEADRVPCEFKGITAIDLVLIEKLLF